MVERANDGRLFADISFFVKTALISHIVRKHERTLFQATIKPFNPIWALTLYMAHHWMVQMFVFAWNNIWHQKEAEKTVENRALLLQKGRS